LTQNKKTTVDPTALAAAYERFVPSTLLRFLEQSSMDSVRLGDHRQMGMTVLFSDIRSFTDLSERLTPEQNFRFLNSYLYQMEPTVTEHGGVIDKFIGDSVMALFDGGADGAVRSALDMLRRLYEYNLGRLRAGYVPIRIGIGLNSGPVMVGIVGGRERMQATVIGDAVNLASRIEGLNKRYGTSLLITEPTRRSLQQPEDFCLRLIDHAAVKGKLETVPIYEVFDGDATDIRQGKLETLPLFNEALTLYMDNQPGEARERFSQVVERNPYDWVARHFVRLCAPEGRIWTEAAYDDSSLELTVRQLIVYGEVETEPGARGSSGRFTPAMLAPLLDAVRMYLPYRAGFGAMEETAYRGGPAGLEEQSVFLELRGCWNGLFVLSADPIAQETLLQSMIGESIHALPIDAEERPAYLTDAVKETANQLLGNALKLFEPHESFIQLSPPVAQLTPDARLRYDTSRIWGSRFVSPGQGCVVVYFLEYRQ
jgi:class 3 adenylate cyclase